MGTGERSGKKCDGYSEEAKHIGPPSPSLSPDERHPGWVIEKLELMPWLAYFSAGGVTSRYLIPRFLEGLFIGADRCLKPLQPVFSLHWHICLRKREENQK